MMKHHASEYTSGRRFGAVALFAMALAAAFSGCTNDKTPPGNVTVFTATAGDTKITLAWINPADSDFAGVLIQRKAGGYPASSTDGTQVYNGMGTSFTDTGLANGTPYYYAAFAYDTSKNHASGAQASAVPTIATALTTVIEQLTHVHDLLAGAPGNTLPTDQVGQLAAKVDAADEAYRSGDTCGAATTLLDYESMAQGFRQGSTQSIIFVGGYERLYNEGRRLRYDMIAGTSMKDLCPGQERVGLAADTAVDETQTDNTQVIATASFGEPKFLTVEANGEVFTQLDIPGSDAITGDPGMPAMPMMRRLIAVPAGAEVSLNFNPQTAETVYVNLIPRQQAPVDADPGPAPDPSTFADLPFVKDEQTYQTDQFLPGEPTMLTEVGQLRDLRVFLVKSPAGQYNPKTNALRLFKKVDVQVKFTGGTGYFLTQASMSPFESNPSLLTGAVINNKSMVKYIDPTAIFRRYLGEEFMILAPNALMDAANALADWKNQKGIVTNVFAVGADTNFVTKEAIADLIKTEYESAKTRPSYVLLLGDAIYIPTFYTTPNGNVGSPTIGTDYPYSAFSGILPIFPDVALGRIPVRNLADANIVVNKIINYEKTPPGHGHESFYGNAAIASHFQCCRTHTVFPGTDQRTFVETSEFARDVLAGAGYNVQRIYTETVDPAYHADAMPVRYYDGTLLPGDLGAGSGFAWNGSEDDILHAYNAGRFLFIHRGHGWINGWINPPFTFADASTNVTNGSLLPVVFSVNCASGLFDEDTAGGALGSTQDAFYFAERMLVNPLGGAVGMLGDTRNSPSWANSALLRGFIDAIWPNAIPGFGDSTSHHRLGDILNHGKVYLFTQGSTSGAIQWGDVGDEFRLWHCLGDPTLEIWTKYPYWTMLPNVIETAANEAALSIHYAAPGATITAVQTDPHNELIPIARGVIGQDGTASLPYVQQPIPGTPIQFVANLPDTVTSMILK